MVVFYSFFLIKNNHGRTWHFHLFIQLICLCADRIEAVRLKMPQITNPPVSLSYPWHLFADNHNIKKMG